MLIDRAADSLSDMLNDRSFCCFSAAVRVCSIRDAAEALHVVAVPQSPPEVRKLCRGGFAPIQVIKRGRR